jgi:hypothetical protein
MIVDANWISSDFARDPISDSVEIKRVVLSEKLTLKLFNVGPIPSLVEGVKA